MSNLRPIIDEFVASRLFNLAWAKNYPIHSDIALDSFTGGFLDSGFEVRYFRETDDLHFQKKDLCSRTCSDILCGSFSYPRGSLASLSDSVEDVCYATKWKVPGVRMSCQSTVISVMSNVESRVYSHMKKYQDKAFLDVNRTQADLNCEPLLDSLISRYSRIDLLETFYVGDVGNYSDDVFHRDLQRRFWANYIERLSEIKGYSVKYTLDTKNAMIQMQNASLVDGCKLF